MKTKISIAIIVILIVLFYIAWKRKTINVSVDKPLSFMQKAGEKAPKSKAPNSKEEKCRDIFEALTGRAYPTVRPNWLKNPKTNRNLELDGFCADLRSAFEYNGKQHYEYPNAFHKTREDFDKLVQRDRIKVQTCRDYGVDLLLIPYYLETSDLESFIEQHLTSEGIIISQSDDTF
jgi:hypothetical protein